MKREAGFGELADLLRRFGEEMRSSLANLRSAAETLDGYPRMDAQRRRQLQGVVLEEARSLSRTLESGLERLEGWHGAHSSRIEIESRQLLETLRRELRERGCRANVTLDPGEEGFRVEADPPALVRGLERLARRLGADLGVDRVEIQLSREPGFATLDLLWDYGSMDLESLMSWQSDTLSLPSEEDAPSVLELARRHGGEAWFNVRRESSTAYLRLLLPLVEEDDG